MANLGTKLFTVFFGQKVGEDEFGNQYYRTKKPSNYIGRYNKERRWVVFKGKAEPSKIPAEWHGWIHFSIDEVPENISDKNKHKWQKSYTPNLTGTDFKYLPSGHSESKGSRDKATGDYQSWKPSN